MKDAWEKDELWLYSVIGKATMEEVEIFCERVAIRMAEDWSENRARRETLREILEARKQ